MAYSPRASGLGNSAAYQVAGKPYLTGSTLAADDVGTVQFPTVSRSFTLVNTGNSYTYIKAIAETGFECLAELTGIQAQDMYVLTGSGINISRYTDGIN